MTGIPIGSAALIDEPRPAQKSAEPSLASPASLRNRSDDAQEQAESKHDGPGVPAKAYEPIDRQFQQAEERQN